jgi:Pathogenicity locus
MKTSNKAKSLRDLRRIPGVGPSIAEDLWNIGIRRVEDLRGGNPDDLYERSCAFQMCRVDRCLLYVYRCAVYYASRKKHDPELLKWWKWSDASVEQRGV